MNAISCTTPMVLLYLCDLLILPFLTAYTEPFSPIGLERHSLNKTTPHISKCPSESLPSGAAYHQRRCQQDFGLSDSGSGMTQSPFGTGEEAGGFLDRMGS